MNTGGRGFAVLFAAVMLSLMAAWAYLGFEAGRIYERAHPTVAAEPEP